MNISEVRVKLVGSTNSNDRLRAFCSITLDDEFVVRDLKVIDGANGPFVAMPSRKLADHCPKCGHKNHLRSKFCNECGQKLDDNRMRRRKRTKLHADIAHPINADCREAIQLMVVRAFEEELERSKLPGYQPAAYDEEDMDEYDGEAQETPSAPQASSADGGYADLIAELKGEARKRRGGSTSLEETEEELSSREPSFYEPDADQDEEFGKGLV